METANREPVELIEVEYDHIIVIIDQGHLVGAAAVLLRPPENRILTIEL